MFISFSSYDNSRRTTTWFISILSSITCWGYVLGFAKTFSIKDGILRYGILFVLQLILQPVFSVMEITGVVCAIVSPPFKAFHIVKKEGRDAVANASDI
jgi:hypothetical protein